MDTTNDLRIMYSGWPAQGVLWIPRTGQGGTNRAIFNEPGTVLFDGQAQFTDASLQYPTENFPDVRQGDRFVVDAHTWIARENASKLTDGSESIVMLGRAK